MTKWWLGADHERNVYIIRLSGDDNRQELEVVPLAQADSIPGGREFLNLVKDIHGRMPAPQPVTEYGEWIFGVNMTALDSTMALVHTREPQFLLFANYDGERFSSFTGEEDLPRKWVKRAYKAFLEFGRMQTPEDAERGRQAEERIAMNQVCTLMPIAVGVLRMRKCKLD